MILEFTTIITQHKNNFMIDNILHIYATVEFLFCVSIC